MTDDDNQRLRAFAASLGETVAALEARIVQTETTVLELIAAIEVRLTAVENRVTDLEDAIQTSRLSDAAD